MFKPRSKLSAEPFYRRLSLEHLEDRRLLAANLNLIDAYLVDGQFNQITSTVLGEKVGVRAVFEAVDLPEGAEYKVDFTIDGVTLTGLTLKGKTDGTFTQNKTGWYATAGEHTVVVKVDGEEVVSESDESDNTGSFQFTPAVGTPPVKAIWPVEGVPFTEIYISNYLDIDPTNGMSDYTGGNASYDGHTAWDLGAGNFHEMDLGVEVYAAAAGTVSSVHDGEFDRQVAWGSPSPTANYVKIDHGDGWQTIYWHLRRDSLQVEVGQVVEAGDFIGYMGSSGKSTAAHLHFGLSHHNRPVEPGIDSETYFIDPLPYVGATPTVYLSGVTNYPPACWGDWKLASCWSDHNQERPSDVEIYRQISGQTTFVWGRFSGLRQNDVLLYVWKKPDSSVYTSISKTISQNYSASLHVFGKSLPAVPDLGTWKVEFKVNGTKIGEDTFVVTSAGAAEILVEEDGEIILDERYTPVDFGTVSLNAASPTKTFTVTNHGDNTLTLSAPVVPTGFSITEGLVSSLVPGASDTFDVSLATATAGYFAGQVRFSSNDADEFEYNFSIEGIVDSLSTDELVLGISERHAREGDSLFANVRRLGDTTNALTVTLTSADLTEISVPSSVTIPAGEERVSFVMQAVEDNDFDEDQVAAVLASATGYATAQNRLHVLNDETLVLSMSATSISEAGGTALVTVTRANTNLDQPLTVDLLSSDLAELTFPVTVTIAANESSASFTATAQDDALLDGPKQVTITASASGYSTVDAELEVTDHETLTIWLANQLIVEKVITSAAVTRSNSDITQPLVVSLSSNDTSEATVPASVTIEAGAASANFHVTSLDDGLDDGTQTVAISAAATGYVSVPADLYVVSHPWPWQNVLNAKDVDGDGSIALLDALVLINEINLNGAYLLPDPTRSFSPPPYYDVNGDGYLTAVDVLVVFNYLNQEAEVEGEAGSLFMIQPAATPCLSKREVHDLVRQEAFSEDLGFLTALSSNTPWPAVLVAGDADTGQREERELAVETWEPLEEVLDSLFFPVL
jgi:hypothetical protein